MEPGDHHAHRCPSSFIMNHVNLINTFGTYFPKIYFNIILLSVCIALKWFFSLQFPIKILYTSLVSPHVWNVKIWSLKKYGVSYICEVPCCVTFSIFLLHPLWRIQMLSSYLCSQTSHVDVLPWFPAHNIEYWRNMKPKFHFIKGKRGTVVPVLN
jgi:hypothetical protein